MGPEGRRVTSACSVVISCEMLSEMVADLCQEAGGRQVYSGSLSEKDGKLGITESPVLALILGDKEQVKSVLFIQ